MVSLKGYRQTNKIINAFLKNVNIKILKNEYIIHFINTNLTTSIFLEIL